MPAPARTTRPWAEGWVSGPPTCFPDFTGHLARLADEAAETELELWGTADGKRFDVAWTRRGRTWSGQNPRGDMPERGVHLRTLANLTSRSAEARALLGMGRESFKEEMVPPSVLVLAHRVLPWEYRPRGSGAREGRDLLFAEVKGDPPAKYSELHMSSAERTILRIPRTSPSSTGRLF